MSWVARGSASRKNVLGLALLLALAVAVVSGVLALETNVREDVPPPATTVSAADLRASPALLRAARAVGFHPNVAPGVGSIESKPLSRAPAVSAGGLLPIGTVAPAFALRTPTGQRVTLAELRGKTTLLEFFATWCPHCAAEAPHLQALAESLPASSYAFVSINADGEDAASIYAYHRYFGLPFPALLDPGSRAGSFHGAGSSGPVSSRYGADTYPTFYVLDRTGHIVWRSKGEQPDALLRRMLHAAAGR